MTLRPFDQLVEAESADELGELIAQAYFVAMQTNDQPVFAIAEMAHKVALDIDPTHAAYVDLMRTRLMTANTQAMDAEDLRPDEDGDSNDPRLCLECPIRQKQPKKTH